MALPDTLYAGSAMAMGLNPPHKSSGGNYYFVLANPGTSPWRMEVSKNTNPGTASWSWQDSANRPTAAGSNILSSASDGTYIHIVTYDGASDLVEYHRFDMSDDTWDSVDNLVADVSGMDTISSYDEEACIAVRGVSGDEVVIVARGLPDSDMGAIKNRIDLWHGAGTGTPSWTGPISVDASVAGEIERVGMCITGSNDVVHLTLTRRDVSNGTIYAKARSFDTTDTLGTLYSSTVASPNSHESRAATMVNVGGTDYAVFGVVQSGGTSNIQTIKAREGTGDEIDQVTAQNVSLSTTYWPGEENALVAEDGVIHLLYSGGGTSGNDDDYYHVTSDDAGATWGTPTELLNTVDITRVSAAVLDTGLIAHVYQESGTIYYDELNIATDITVVVGSASETDSAQTVAPVEPVFAITDVDTDETIHHGQSAVITGTEFGATQGNGSVWIGDVEQTVTSWGNTSITITVNQGALALGAQTLRVRKKLS